MNPQLTLGIGLKDSATLANFHSSGNAAAVEQVAELAREPRAASAFIHGASGTGKTHLLQAACAAALEDGQRAGYLPLGEAARWTPDVLEGWEDLPLVCLDDMQAIAGNAAWERAVFRLFNGVREQGGRWLAAADAAPGQLHLSLPDLASRLSWGAVFRLKELSDGDKCAALRLRAACRGFDLPEDTAAWLLNRYQRDMRSLCSLLDVLDSASLAAQRKLTIPFVRGVLPSAS